jgi:hypothetical protein
MLSPHTKLPLLNSNKMNIMIMSINTTLSYTLDVGSISLTYYYWVTPYLYPMYSVELSIQPFSESYTTSLECLVSY